MLDRGPLCPAQPAFSSSKSGDTRKSKPRIAQYELAFRMAGFGAGNLTDLSSESASIVRSLRPRIARRARQFSRPNCMLARRLLGNAASRFVQLLSPRLGTNHNGLPLETSPRQARPGHIGPTAKPPLILDPQAARACWKGHVGVVWAGEFRTARVLRPGAPLQAPITTAANHHGPVLSSVWLRRRRHQAGPLVLWRKPTTFGYNVARGFPSNVHDLKRDDPPFASASTNESLHVFRFPGPRLSPQPIVAMAHNRPNGILGVNACRGLLRAFFPPRPLILCRRPWEWRSMPRAGNDVKNRADEKRVQLFQTRRSSRSRHPPRRLAFG